MSEPKGIAGTIAGLEAQVGELIESRARKRAKRDWSQYETDPVGWARDVLGFEPWSRQEEIMRSVVDYPLTVARGANGTGKDAVSFGPVALHHVFVRGGLVVAIAPTERQVVEIGMKRELGRWWRAGKLEGELYTSALRVDDDRGVLTMTSNAVSKLTGFHHPRLLVILSEAQGLEPFVWEAALACCVGEEDRILAVGNPIVLGGDFYQASKPNSGWNAIKLPANEHPNVTTGKTVIPGGISRLGIARFASTYGTGSATYKSRIEAEFPEQGDEALISRQGLEVAKNAWESGLFDVVASNWAALLAVDPARYGPDFSCVAVRHGPKLSRLALWHGADTMQTVTRVVEEALSENMLPAGVRFGPLGRIRVDTVGLGSGVLDRLKERGWLTDEYVGGRFTTATNRSRFLNERAKSFWHLRLLLENNRIALPFDELLWDELLSIKWKPDGNDRIQIEPKADLKKRLGRSPDRADAVCMAFSDYERNEQALRMYETTV